MGKFAGMEYRVLGTLEVLRDGELVPLDSTKQRALLAALLIHANEVVSTVTVQDLLDEVTRFKQATGRLLSHHGGTYV